MAPPGEHGEFVDCADDERRRVLVDRLVDDANRKRLLPLGEGAARMFLRLLRGALEDQPPSTLRVPVAIGIIELRSAPRAGEELEDAFADHTADQIEQIVQEHMSKEDTTGVGLVDEGVPPDAAGAQQDDVPSRHRQLVERDEYISELQQQLADIQKQLIAQRTLAATHNQTAAATQAQLISDLRSSEEYISEFEAVSIAETKRLEMELREITEYTEEFEATSIAELARATDEISQLRAQLAAAGRGDP